MDINKKLIFSPELNNSIIKKIGEIEKFQGKWETLKVDNNQFLNELRYIATIQSIGSSTRIEGSELDDEEVKHLIENLEISQLESRDQQEVIGYWETLELIINQFDKIDLSERYIFQLHGILLKYCNKDIRQRGKYKNLSNSVVAKYPDGSQKTIFNTTQPHLVSEEMTQLINWVIKELKKQAINPLIIVSTFIYEFLSIHPFHDGNGRLSRLLTTLLLLKEKYYFVQYVSFEHIIEKQKKEYYQSLMDCQKNRNTSDETIGIWINFFLECILKLSNQLESKIDRILLKDIYLNQRQKEILNFIAHSGKVRTADVSQHIESSIATIKKDLKYLVEQKLIEKKGAGKATTYSIM